MLASHRASRRLHKSIHTREFISVGEPKNLERTSTGVGDRDASRVDGKPADGDVSGDRPFVEVGPSGVDDGSAVLLEAEDICARIGVEADEFVRSVVPRAEIGTDLLRLLGDAAHVEPLVERRQTLRKKTISHLAVASERNDPSVRHRRRAVLRALVHREPRGGLGAVADLPDESVDVDVSRVVERNATSIKDDADSPDLR